MVLVSAIRIGGSAGREKSKSRQGKFFAGSLELKLETNYDFFFAGVLAGAFVPPSPAFLVDFLPLFLCAFL
jgi:hypothetical protein